MGMDKALLEFCGKPLVKYMVDKVGIFADRLVVSVGRRRLGLSCLEIEDVKGEGPIAGIYSVLLHFDRVLFVPVDMPLLEPEVFEPLWKSSFQNHIAVCRIRGRIQPLLGVYTRKAFTFLGEAIDRGDFSLVKLIKRCQPYLKVGFLEAEDFGWDPKWFINVNTLRELEIAKRYKAC